MRRIMMAFTVIAAVTYVESANADGDPKRSKELQVLERFVGTWESVVTNITTGKKSNTIEQRKWSRKGQFILSEDFDNSTMKEAHFLLTHDPKGKVYRACFINESGASNYVGNWDEKSNTMSWDGTDTFGNKQAGTYHFIDKDRVEWSIVFTNPDGKVVLELSAKQTRRKN